MLEISFTKKTIRGSLAKQILRLSRKILIKNPIYSDKSFGKLYSLSVTESFRYPKDIQSEWIDLSHSRMEKISSSRNESNNAILQFHGGAYVKPYSDTYRRSAIQYHRRSGGAAIFSLDYRIAPKDPFPAALDDAIEAYECLIKLGYQPNHIIVVGDSAGGGLTLAMTMKLREMNKPLPKALLTMSAWTDLSSSGESYIKNQNLDPMLGDYLFPLQNNDYVGDHDRTDPYISPFYGTYEGFPPMMMHVGTHEVLESDTLMVAKKASDAGVNVKLTLYRGMFHVFQLAFGLIPESKKAWNEIEHFLKEQFENTNQ